MWELDHVERWVPQNWCFWTVVLEKTLESPLDCKEIQLVIPKGNQSWTFIGRNDVEAETPILWPPNMNWLLGKDPDARQDWWEEEKGITEDEMVGWHRQLDGHEFEQALGVGEGQGSLVGCSPWGRKSWMWLSDSAELNWNSQVLLKGSCLPRPFGAAPSFEVHPWAPLPGCQCADLVLGQPGRLWMLLISHVDGTVLLSVSLVDRQWNWQDTPPLVTLYVKPQIVLLVSIKPHRLHSISTLVSERLLISADYSYFCFLKFSKFYRLFLWEAVF